MIIFVIIIGASAIGARSCDHLEYPANLEMATCQACLAEGCIDCSGGSKKCNECEVGMTVLDGFTCIDCDDDPLLNKCLSCNHNGIRATCLDCAEGYRLENGECLDCVDVGENCADCRENVCRRCFTGFFLDSSNQCQPCKDSLNHCLECSDENTC